MRKWLGGQGKKSVYAGLADCPGWPAGAHTLGMPLRPFAWAGTLGDLYSAALNYTALLDSTILQCYSVVSHSLLDSFLLYYSRLYHSSILLCST